MGITQYVTSMSKTDKFWYMILVVMIIWGFNTVYVPNIAFIVAILTSITLIYFFNEIKLESGYNLNINLENKLNSILHDEAPPEYMYLEPDMINFFDSISDFKLYNVKSFTKIVKNTNNLLSLKSTLLNDFTYIKESKKESWQNFGPTLNPTKTNNIQNLKNIFNASVSSSYKALNYLQSLYINLPAGLSNKHKTAVKRFHVLLKRILDDILEHCKNNSGDLLIGNDYGLPKAFINKSTGARAFDFF